MSLRTQNALLLASQVTLYAVIQVTSPLASQVLPYIFVTANTTLDTVSQTACYWVFLNLSLSLQVQKTIWSQFLL